jgi:hypothetical protein
LLPTVTKNDGTEAQKMASFLEELRRPYGREHWELIKSGREGSYWQAADGLIVRLAVAEAVHQADGIARMLLNLAIQYASGK